MPYTQEISRSNPSCLIFMIDQSASMQDAIGGESPHRKADVVADAINRLLRELTIKCAKEEGVRDYFEVAVVGYGVGVGSAFSGTLAGRDLVPLSHVAENPSRIETRSKKVPDGAGGLVEQDTKFPIWMDPTANGGTPMNQAVTFARTLAARFLDGHPSCFPPVVLNLTDGESTDGDPSAAATSLQSLASTDGNTLLFNLHVSSSGGQPTEFPGADSALADQFAKQLFHMSSVLPPHMRSYAASEGKAVTETSRGFVYNADITSIIQFLDIGTRATDLR